MNGLADIVLDYLCTMMFPPEGDIDSGYASRVMQSFPELLTGLSTEERVALSAAAGRALANLQRPPDEHGYSPAGTVSEDQIAFLETLASGELYEQWCQD